MLGNTCSYHRTTAKKNCSSISDQKKHCHYKDDFVKMLFEYLK